LYRIVSGPQFDDQIAALPAEALRFCAEAFDVLRLVPEKGLLYNERKPDGLRVLKFGPDRDYEIIYLILLDQREVHPLRLLWVDLEND
jgi:hypothetical protein